MPPFKTITHKVCSKCLERKPKTEYYKVSCRPGTLMARCKKCYRELTKAWEIKNRDRLNALARKYSKRNRSAPTVRWIVRKKLGSTRENAKKFGYAPCNITVDELEANYTTMCQVCNKECGSSIHLDHCHKSGRFRGWLCGGCNSAIGHAGDSVEVLYSLIEYLSRT